MEPGGYTEGVFTLAIAFIPYVSDSLPHLCKVPHKSII